MGARERLAIYLENFAHYNALYGSLGAAVAFMVFVFLAAIVLLVSAAASRWPEVAAASRPKPDGEPASRKVKRALAGPGGPSLTRAP